MNKTTKILLALLALIILSVIGYRFFTTDKPALPAESTKRASNTPAVSTADTTEAKQGRYTKYSSGAVADNGYQTSVVFFFAPWCPECQAFKKSINGEPLPKGVQILEADYDSSTDLKKHYGVTLQSTFVRVNKSGDLQKKWVGYGKDKSLKTVLENLK